jgi:hypothetical protein
VEGVMDVANEMDQELEGNGLGFGRCLRVHKPGCVRADLQHCA